MNIRLKSREFFIKVSSKVEVINDALIKALTWDEQWNARRIWRNQHRRYTTFQLI